jgi:hypothetical protein
MPKSNNKEEKYKVDLLAFTIVLYAKVNKLG